MVIEPLVVDPPLPSLPDWGVPQPLWWFLLLALILLLVGYYRHKLRLAAKNAPWYDLQQTLDTTARQPSRHQAKQLSLVLKRTLLHYLPRQHIASLTLPEAIELLCRHCHIDLGDGVQQWLVGACYREIDTPPATNVVDGLRRIVKAMQVVGPPQATKYD